MLGGKSFSTETWNNCIKLVEGTITLSELNWSFSEASVWLWNFRKVLIEKLERQKNLIDADNKDKALDFINKVKDLEKRYIKDAKSTKDFNKEPL